MFRLAIPRGFLRSFSTAAVHSHSLKLHGRHQLSKASSGLWTRSLPTGLLLTGNWHLVVPQPRLVHSDYALQEPLALKPATVHKVAPTTIDQSSWRLLWRYIKRDWLLLVGVCATAIATALVNIATPRVIGKLANIISSAIKSPNWVSMLADIRGPAVMLCGLFALQGFLTFIYIGAVSVFGENVAVALRKDLFGTFLRQDMSFFDSMRVGELVGRLSDDVAEFKHSLKICVSQGLKSVTLIIGSVVQLFSISFTLTSYLLMAAPILYGIGNVYGAFLRQLSKRAKDADGSSSAIATEALSNIRTVRSFTNEEFELDHYERSLHASSDANKHLGYHIGIFQGFTNFAIGGMIVFVLYLGGNLVAANELSGGDLMSYLISIQNAQKAMASLSVLFAQSLKAGSAFTRIQEHMQFKPIIPNSGGRKLPLLHGDISFNNVRFAYPVRAAHQVFDGFTLDIPAGKVYAFCGSSGAGKSTIAALIERFYDVADGSITVDGVDIRDLDPKWLRENIGFIHQEPILFAGSIIDNITYGKHDASPAEIEAAVRAANAYDFIQSLPDKYNSLVGERGVTLSGGQRQRIAIARALLKNPKILIFDEATSALDAESERIVQEALNRLMSGRTVILIAHRLSTIQNADQIVVLGRGGKILETGTHEELMRRQQAYFNLYTTANSK